MTPDNCIFITYKEKLRSIGYNYRLRPLYIRPRNYTYSLPQILVAEGHGNCIEINLIWKIAVYRLDLLGPVK